MGRDASLVLGWSSVLQICASRKLTAGLFFLMHAWSVYSRIFFFFDMKQPYSLAKRDLQPS